MSGVSRRAVLGYSGSAAAGAVIASTGSAQAAESQAPVAQAPVAQAADAEQASAIEWGPGTEFRGHSSIGDVDASMTVKFSLDIEYAPSGKAITALDIAEAINKLVESRGWPRIQFHGMVSAPLN
ncbi:hypothetical protein [Streptomyces sp. NPDC003032]